MSEGAPKYWIKFFRWFCNPDYVEDIEGDLLERFEKRALEGGKAKIHFIKDVLLLFRPGIIRKFSNNHKMPESGIVKNYITTSFRSAKKEKAFSIMNVLGLSIGFVACLYVGMYSLDELRYDTFHEKADRIYRINQTFIWGEIDELFGSTGPGVMTAIVEEVPEFETMTRVHPMGDFLVSAISGNNVKVFEEDGILAVDSTFFQVFTFPTLKGSPNTALINPNSLVITKSMATKYFGSTDVLGKQLIFGERGNEKTYQITSVVDDVPASSHIQFNFLISMSSIDRLKRQYDSWWWTTFVTFGVLHPDADVQQVAKKVADVPGKYLGPFLQRYSGMTYEEFLEEGKTWELYIQPLLDIHLRSTNVLSRLNKVGDIKTLYTLASIAGLILFLSVINFVNLSTARSSKRAKEVGVRKVLGSRRQNLIWQFTIESVFFCTIALLIAGLIVGFLLPYFNSVSGKQIPLELMSDPKLIATTLIATIVIGTIAGVYPAFYLSAFRPTQVLKGKLTLGSHGSFVRNSLVTVQFAISIGLIACALIINQQVQHWMNMDLGFNRENKLVIQNVDRLDKSMKAFQNKISSFPQIDQISFSSDTPPYIWHNDQGFHLKGNSETQKDISFMTIDENFMDVYGLTLIAGRNFTGDQSEANGVLVSRSFTESFGMSEPSQALNHSLTNVNDDSTSRLTGVKIIGVFEDFTSEINWEQLPIALYSEGSVYIQLSSRVLTLSLQKGITSNQVSNLLAELENKWFEFNPKAPFKYTFSDQEYEMIFEKDIKFGQLMNFYALLAIIIAGLGLTGLVAYVIERRNKEVGIRKVLGASVSSILVLLTSEFGKLLLIGFILASSISWYFMHTWIEKFAYRITITPITFLLAGLAMLVIVVLTLSYQTIRTAKSNPVKYLKDE